MNARRCSRRADAQVALGALRQVRDEKQWVRPAAVQEALRACIRQVSLHRRHDGMGTQQTAALTGCVDRTRAEEKHRHSERRVHPGCARLDAHRERAPFRIGMYREGVLQALVADRSGGRSHEHQCPCSLITAT